MIPFLAGIRWLLGKYVRPRIKERTWFLSQKSINDVHAAVIIILGIALAGFLVT